MILITGAAGMSGRMIVEAMVRRGTPVRVLVRSQANASAFAARKGIEVVCADMSRPDTLAPALQGVKTVMLISSADEHMTHTQCTFVDAAKAAGVGNRLRRQRFSLHTHASGDRAAYPGFGLALAAFAPQPVHAGLSA